MLERLLFVLACLFSTHVAAGEPLEPEKAFRFSAQMLDAQTIEVRWDIAPGYYMYRDKFSFTLEPAAASVSKVDTPAGVIKEDENFGRVEIYHDAVRVRLTVAGADGAVVLHATSQGCADIGICYPPQKSVANLVVPAESAAVPEGGVMTWQQRLLQPTILGPTLLSLVGVVLVLLPSPTRKRLLLQKGIGVALLVISAFMLVLLNKDSATIAAHLEPQFTLATVVS
ncbi:MAG TPA: protein-disulfide reductase DsbD N-terminal domain-containing protein [Rhodocyclaceae bacterium]|jgi:hypothetical protein|nr:protein-disulfide reductase DsbD N-terminal domain-containing protein [Rhodocyclaceae bacterium]